MLRSILPMVMRPCVANCKIRRFLSFSPGTKLGTKWSPKNMCKNRPGVNRGGSFSSAFDPQKKHRTTSFLDFLIRATKKTPNNTVQNREPELMRNSLRDGKQHAGKPVIPSLLPIANDCYFYKPGTP